MIQKKTLSLHTIDWTYMHITIVNDMHNILYKKDKK